MSCDATDLLEHVDKWKFALHEQLKGMSPEERAAFWKQYEKLGPGKSSSRSKGKKPRKRSASRR